MFVFHDLPPSCVQSPQGMSYFLSLLPHPLCLIMEREFELHFQDSNLGDQFCLPHNTLEAQDLE